MEARLTKPGAVKTAIMGFGNPTRSDDGVGVYVIEQLKAKCSEQEHVSLFDMGTSAFEVLFQLKGHQKIIVVDALVNSGEPPGTLFKVPAKELEASVQDDPMVFLHSLKWSQALSYAKKILQDAYPKDIHAYLISVNNTKMDIHLSAEVKKAGDALVDRILKEDLS